MGIATPLSERQLLQENQHAFHDVWATSELMLQAEDRDMWSCLAAEGFDHASEPEVRALVPSRSREIDPHPVPY